MEFRALLGRICAGDPLTVEEMSFAMDALMQGRVSEEETALLLVGLRTKGETVDELAGAALAMRRHMTRIRSQREGILDTCGTGGNASATFNISTAAALVAAAAGVPVAKHGNRSITSRSGSADVLSALGVNLAAPVEVTERCLDELGICFCFAPRLHPAMKNVAAARQKVGGRTIFNLLGPLSNPAGAAYQLLGVTRDELRPLMARALVLLQIRRAIVVCGEDSMGEVTLSGATRATVIENGQLEEQVWRPEDFGLAVASKEALLVDGPAASAAIIRSVLAGEPGPPRDIVLMNAAAGLWTASAEPTLKACLARAAEAVDSRRAEQLLARLVAFTA